MSGVILSGDVSGTVTLAPPSAAGSNTINVPAATGTMVVTGQSATVSQSMLAANVAGNGPAFSAYATANQSIPSNTFTKIQLPFELFDTNSNFDSTTNYRFTPTVAGYYQINAGVSSTSTGIILVSIFKNGSEVIRGNQILSDPTVRLGVVSGVIQMNGSTDYIELYFFQTAATAQNTTGGQSTLYMNGFMARAA